jgi:hypothetical protein
MANVRTFIRRLAGILDIDGSGLAAEAKDHQFGSAADCRCDGLDQNFSVAT